MTIHNEVSENPKVFKSEGNMVLAPGESSVICFERNAGGVQVHIGGVGAAAYQIHSTLATVSEIEGDTAVYLPYEASDITKDSDAFFEEGASGTKIENKAISTDSITVYWGYKR